MISTNYGNFVISVFKEKIGRYQLNKQLVPADP